MLLAPAAVLAQVRHFLPACRRCAGQRAATLHRNARDKEYSFGAGVRGEQAVDPL